MKRRELIVCVVLILLASGPASSQQPAQTAPASLASAARQAASSYRPIPAQEVAQAKGELSQATSGLDAFLRTGAPAKAMGWKRYLQWNDLEAIGAANQPASQELIAKLIGKLTAEQTGLDLPVFTRLRRALADYGEIAAASANASPAEHAKRVEDLATQLDAYSQDPANGDAALAIGRGLGWLQAHRQSPELVSSVRQAYGRANFLGHASQRLAAAGIEREIDQVTAVSDNILGTALHGTARLVGRTTLSLDENPSAAHMNILLGGTAWSNNVGYHGPVTIFTTGVTSVSARKRIVMNAEGLLGYATQASCGTRSSINDICAKCGLIERMAWKRAGKQQGQAEQIASQHAAGRVARQVDAEAGEQVAEQNTRFQEKVRGPLLRRGEFPEDLTFSTTPDRVQLRMRQESAGLLAAPSEPPALLSEHDLAAQAHESAIINFGQGLLGGFELTDLRLEKLIRDDLKAELTDELRVTRPDGTLDTDKEPWSIQFAKDLPVRARFSGGGLWIAIRAEGFTRGEGETPGKYKPALSELIEIAAAYKIEKTEQGATLRRDGDVQVRFPNRANPEQITLRDSPIVTFIRRKFRSLYKEDFVGEGLVLKGAWEKAGRLRLAEIASDGGWLRLGWSLPAGAATTGAE